jgi:hypothetical protein
MRYSREVEGYQILGREVRHVDALALMDGHTETRRLIAHHWQVTKPTKTKGYRVLEATIVNQGVWFSRWFRSTQDAIRFVAGKTGRLPA